MPTSFDMELFLSGVLNGSHATRQRHLRQARTMQIAIKKRWKRDTPWNWQIKHVKWFIDRYLDNHAPSTRYYYLLTVRLIYIRLGKREYEVGSRLGLKPSNSRLRLNRR